MEGEEPYLLHSATSATKLPDGRIVVANGGSQELRVFDASGTHLATWGGRGEGPGEFTGLGAVKPWPGDSIIAWYSQGLGISVFDSGGNFGRSFSLRGSQPRFGPQARAVRRDGAILAIKAPPSADTAVVELRDGDGALSVSLGAYPSGEPVFTDTGSLTWVLFGRELFIELWGDLVVISPTTRYEIRAFRADGALVQIVRRDHLPRTPTQADLEHHIEEELSRWEDVTDVTPEFQAQWREAIQSTPRAKTYPAFSSIMGDAAGHLWVREYDFPGEERAAPLWTVFDPGGRVLGFVETPKELDWILEIGEDHLLGHATDELGVESIQLWPLERSAG